MLVSDQIAALRAMGIDGNEQVLTALLRKTSYNLEAAVSLYFQEAVSSSSNVTAKGSTKTERRSGTNSAVVINVDDSDEVEIVGSHSGSAISSGKNSSNVDNRNNSKSNIKSNSSSNSKVPVAPSLVQRKRKVEEEEVQLIILFDVTIFQRNHPNLFTPYFYRYSSFSEDALFVVFRERMDICFSVNECY